MIQICFECIKKKQKVCMGKISLFILILLFLFSCNENSTGNDKNDCLKQGPDVLLPLTVGNYWNYQVEHSWTDSVKYIVSKKMQVEYEGEELEAYVYGKENGNINWLYMNKEDGLYLVGGYTEYDTLIHPILQFKYPVNKGETWQFPRMVYHLYENKFYFKDTLTYTCVDTDFIVHTNIDSFSTNVYLYSLKPAPDVQMKEDYYSYFSPYNGRVYWKLTHEGDPNRIIADMDLYDYCLKP